MATPKTAPANQLPDFIQNINNDYKAQISHVFVVHGNIYDYIDNKSSNSSIRDILSVTYDDNESKVAAGTPATVNDSSLIASGNKEASMIRVMAFFNISHGLVFPNNTSRELWRESQMSILGKSLDEDMPGWDRPSGPGSFVVCMNRWFDVSKRIYQRNQKAAKEGKPLTKELVFTLVITDADALVPQGGLDKLTSDRAPIVAMRNWSKDNMVGLRNRIVLMTRHPADINESIKAELAVSHLVRKPNLEDRKEWLQNFDKNVQDSAKEGGRPVVISGTTITKVNYAEDFSAEQFAIQSAGMNRQQLKDVIMDSWMSKTPIDFFKVSSRKQRALEDEYDGMLDFKEPSFGFDQVGGHEHFKKYCQRKIIQPLKTGNTKMCSRGVLLTGPPGVGKSVASWALAKEAGLNYLEVDLGKCFGSLVGESEKNIRKLIEGIEAASPCIVFIDEIDSVLSSGRTSSGDSGTSGRVFNSFMTWMSNPSRRGKVVVIAATNRPDLLDSALIRTGRFDIKIPFLPAGKGDVKGRKEILVALKKKNDFIYHSELGATEMNPNSGFGRLLLDAKRYWTGAEIESLLQDASDNAYFAGRVNSKGEPTNAIRIEDFDTAFEDMVPNTEEVERQIDLALYFADKFAYVPKEYHEIGKNKKVLKARLGLDSNA